jgi:hypothetical protein
MVETLLAHPKLRREPLAYYRRDETIAWDWRLSPEGPTVTLLADDVVRVRDNDLRATVTALVEGYPVTYDRLNVHSRGDRTTLGNEAHKQLTRAFPDVLITADDLKLRLMHFALGLWDEVVSECLPELSLGSENDPVVSFVLEPLVVDGGGTIAFGPPGRGKSYTMMLLATAIDAGLREPWPVPRPRKVLWINLERDRRMVLARLGRINRALGLPATRGLHMFHARGRTLQEVLPAAQKYIREHGVEVVFLDSITRAGYGDLTENAPANRAMDGLNRLCPTWVAIGHTPRADDDHVFGSQMFDAACDVAVKLLSQQEEDGPLGIQLLITKGNDVGKRRLPALALDFSAAGLEGIRSARRGEFLDLEEARHRPTAKDRIRDYLLDHPLGKSHAAEIALALDLNRTTVVEALQDAALFTALGKDGRTAYYGVLGNP